MPKVDEAISILKALGLPKPSAKAAYTLLALANMNERKSWRSAASRSMRIHDIIVAIRDVFKVGYAENTREPNRFSSRSSVRGSSTAIPTIRSWRRTIRGPTTRCQPMLWKC